MISHGFSINVYMFLCFIKRFSNWGFVGNLREKKKLNYKKRYTSNINCG